TLGSPAPEQQQGTVEVADQGRLDEALRPRSGCRKKFYRPPSLRAAPPAQGPSPQAVVVVLPPVRTRLGREGLQEVIPIRDRRREPGVVDGQARQHFVVEEALGALDPEGTAVVAVLLELQVLVCAR